MRARGPRVRPGSAWRRHRAGRGLGRERSRALTPFVTFDCWQTLLDDGDPARARAIRIRHVREAARRAGASGDEAARAFESACRRQFDAWHTSKQAGPREVARWSLEHLGVARDAAAELASELGEALAGAALETGVVALAGSHETLAGLRRTGVRTALVCDTGITPGRVVRRLLARCGLLETLDALAFSDEVGVPKPDPLIFEHALAALGATGRETTHVGDQLRTDVSGARRVGMRTIRIRDRHDDPSDLAEADHVADDHAHLRRLLGL